MPAGSCLSPILCEGVLNAVDGYIMEKFEKHLKCWFRYVDDVFSAVNDLNQADNMLVELNKYHESLQFTCEFENPPGEGIIGPHLPFLDVLIVRLAQGCICDHFIKPTQTTRAIRYDSNHPRQVLRAAVLGEVKRSLSHCSTKKLQDNQVHRIVDKYLQNKYPLDVIMAAVKKGKSGLGKVKGPKVQEDVKWVKMPYVAGLFEECKKVLKSGSVRLAPSVTTTVGSWLVGGKREDGGGGRGAQEVDCVVYCINCKHCSSIYIGQTGRKLNERLKEHERAINKGDKSNACAKHTDESKHEMDLLNVKVV